jgi:transitional endoplasmic reticulum ATPase
MTTFTDPILTALAQAFEANQNDERIKKLFALELFARGEIRHAYPLLLDIAEEDEDLTLHRAIHQIEDQLPELKKVSLGFGTAPSASTVLQQLDERKRAGITFADIAGMEQVKEAIRTDILYPLKNPEMAKLYNMKVGGGILMYGPPGCGKTYIAKATAGEIDAEFISVSIHEVISGFMGAGEQLLHYWFEEARKKAPCVLFFDEIDAIASSRSNTSGVYRTMVNQFLTEMDGVTGNNKNVLVVGATNLPWEVDSALRRPGRFDKLIFVPPPDEKARRKILDLKLMGKPLGELHLDEIVAATAGFSSADMTKVCDEAVDRAFKRALVSGTPVPVSQTFLVEGISATRNSTGDWFKTAESYVKFSNEAGLWDDVKTYLERSRA